MPFVKPDLSGEFEPFVEIDPTGRYGRYNELLGSGAVKKVYRAFDQEEGIEVAWNQVRFWTLTNDPAMVDRLYSEVRLLRSLANKNIIALYNFWRDDEHNSLNFITEVCTSGNLREYRKKHKQVSMKALKKWSKQILKGLNYMHMHEPCIIHRDLNCSNIFVNGNTGQVMIILLFLFALYWNFYFFFVLAITCFCLIDNEMGEEWFFFLKKRHWVFLVFGSESNFQFVVILLRTLPLLESMNVWLGSFFKEK